MKKIFFILTVAMMQLIATANAEDVSELLTNGDFENGISGYSIAYSGKNDTVLPKMFETDKYVSNGDRALELVSGADLTYKESNSLLSKGFAYQGISANTEFETKDGMEYKISGDIYTTKENIKVRFILTDGAKAVYSSEEMEITPNSWNKANYIWKPDKIYKNAKLRVVFYDIKKGDKIYIDNLSVKPDALSNEMWQPITAESVLCDSDKVTFSAASSAIEKAAGVKCSIDKSILNAGEYVLNGYVSTDLEKAYVKLSCKNIDGTSEYYIVKKGEKTQVQLVIDPESYNGEALELRVEVFGKSTQSSHNVEMYDFNLLDSNCIVNIEETETDELAVSGVLRAGNENAEIDAAVTPEHTFKVNVDSQNEYSFKITPVFSDELMQTVTVELSNIKGYSDVGGKISGVYMAVNNELVNSTAELADATTDKEELAKLISEELTDALGVSVTDVYRAADKDFVIGYLLDKDISDADKLKNEMLSAACISALDSDKVKLSYVLDQYAAILGFEELDSYKDLYNEKTDKEKLNEKFSSLSVELEDVDTLHQTAAYALIKQQIENEATYSAAMEVIETYSEEIGLELDAYNKLSTTKQHDVQEKFIKYVKTENDYTKLSQTLKKYANNAANQSTTQGGGSSGGSSGGGSYSVKSTETVIDKTGNSEEYKFNDISDYAWAKDSIYKLYQSGVISASADNCFNPGRYITRAEFAKMAAVLFGKTDYDDIEIYSDVTKDKWYYQYVMSLKKSGIITGVSEDLFAADANITRQDICVIVSRALGGEGSVALEEVFADYANISEYAQGAVGYMYENGYISGYEDETFRPTNFATRAEVAKILGSLK